MLYHVGILALLFGNTHTESEEMKTFVAAITLAVALPIGGTAHAETSAVDDAINDATCIVVGMLAKQIMSARQSGVPMSKVLGVLDGEDANADGLTRTLTIQAYDYPRFSGSEYQERAITEFENEAMVMCYQA